MGNTCGCPGGTGYKYPVNPTPPSTPPRNSVITDGPENNEKYLEDMLQRTKQFHKDRLRLELEQEPHKFVMDNLLMCIQFFDNFEKSREAASEFKHQTEREMTKLLNQEPLDGTILGDRRVKLLTGMSHILAQNYVYGARQEDEDSLYGGIHLKDTFITEGILSLDFIVTWENLEVYDDSEKEDLKHYSDPKGATPIVRFCMEQPKKTTDFPPGFVRLRCVDEPICMRRKLDTPHYSSSDFGYAGDIGEPVYNIPEASSESDEQSPSSSIKDEDEEDKEMKEFQEKLKSVGGFAMTRKIKSEHETKVDDKLSNMPSTSQAMQKRTVVPTKPPSKRHPLPPLILTSESNPSFTVQSSTPPVLDATESFENLGLLHPHFNPGRILNSQKWSKSVPNLGELPRDSPGKESSGYETTSTRSNASSSGSEHLRDKWQKMNLKRLIDFVEKTRKNEIPPDGRYDPLLENCYSTIKFEKNSLEDLEDEDENNSTDDESDLSDDLDFNSDSDSEKESKKSEDVVDIRHYLNSLQVSSNACSEFHFIGPKISIPQSSITQGAVLGTTIRCPIPYQYPQENENDDESTLGTYYITYTFTPSLHSKSWPRNLYFRFNNPIFEKVKDTQSELWPSRDQMERIEKLGCNAIPLGYRSTDFFNAEQILEWELNFQECEENLLNSLRSPHWRAYIFAAILFRAFIAPLGPRGIGLEHLRHILYQMCNDDFSRWDDEQPGTHLIALLEKLFKFLSLFRIPSFFIRSRNLLQGIPHPNISLVQANLKKIRDNLIVYTIYAFRNLKQVKNTPTSFVLPSFKKLFEILTIPDGEVLSIRTPFFQMQNDQEDERKRNEERQRSRKKRKRNPAQDILLNQEDSIDKEFFNAQRERLAEKQGGQLKVKTDKINQKLWSGYGKYQQQLENIKLNEQLNKLKEHEKLKHNPEERVPKLERRKSINLRKEPILKGKFKVFRILLVAQFFIKHFLEMAQKAFDMQSYGQASMYVMQVENLTEIVQEDRYQEALNPFEEDELDLYRQKTLRLRSLLGKDMYQYIISRFTTQSRTSVLPSLNDTQTPTTGSFPTFTNNWDLRKLPPPPTPPREILAQGKMFSKPDIASSLQSFPQRTVDSPPPLPPSPALPPDHRLPRRESIKFVESPISESIKDPTPPETPPRPRSVMAFGRGLPRQSINISMDYDGEDSTDL